MVVWEGLGNVLGQRFDAAGNELGGVFQVNTNGILSGGGEIADFGGSAPSVAGLSALDAVTPGGFVAVWASFPGSNAQVHGQRFDASGNPVGDEFVVVAGLDIRPDASVAALKGGGFVVSWQHTQDADAVAGDIFARVFDAAGAPVSTPFQVNTSDDGLQQQVGFFTQPIVGLADGSFVAIWEVSY